MTKQYTPRQVLLDFKKSDDPNAKLAAEEFLRTLDDEQFVLELFNYLDSPNQETRDITRHAFYHIANSALAPFFLTNLTSDSWRRRAIAANYFYRTANPIAFEQLLECLKDEEHLVRFLAVVALGNIGDKRATLPILTALNDRTEHKRVRRWAANSLLRLDYKAHLTAYLPIVTNNQDNSEVREAVIYLYQRARDKVALPALLKLADSKTDPVRGQALLALSVFNSKDAYNTLLEALTDADETIRQRGLEGLGKLGFPAANRFIIGFLRDKNAQTRYYAVEALGRLRASEALPQLEWLRDNDAATLEIQGETDSIVAIAKSAIRRIQEPYMNIDFFYFADCPSHERALEILREVMDEQRVKETVRIIEVTTDEEARQWNFYGSPTIRVNGQDIAPLPTDIAEPGLACRAYRRPDGKISPLPPREFIAAALEQAEH